MFRRHAFTLVELLVVTVIITILIGMTGVMIKNAKADAKQATCAFNLRQMGVGVNSYLQDFDDAYPQTKGHSTQQPAIDDAAGLIESPSRGSMLGLLGVYGSGLADCPSDPDADNAFCSTVPTASASVNSYNVNGFFVWGLNQGQVANGVASTIFLGERRNSQAGSTPPNCDVIYRPWYTPDNPLAPQNDMDPTAGALDTKRHFDGANYLFADGHAKNLEWGRTIGGGQNFHLPY